MGRGGKNSRHPGNEQLRTFCHNAAIEYSRSGKNEKSQLSRDLIILVRQLNPPGRFLKKDQFAEAWMDVGDIAAREKTSQVLRDAVNALPQDCECVSQRPIPPEGNISSSPRSMDAGDIAAREKTSQVLRDAVNALPQDCECVSQRPIPPEGNVSSSPRSKLRPIKRSDNKVFPPKPYALQNLLVGLEQGQNKKPKAMQRRGNVIVNAIKPSTAAAQEPLLVRKYTPSIPYTDRKRMVADGDRVFQHADPLVCDDTPLSSVGVNPSTRDSRHSSLSSRINDSPFAHKPSMPCRREESIDDLFLDWPDGLPRVGSFDDISKWDSEIHTNR